MTPESISSYLSNQPDLSVNFAPPGEGVTSLIGEGFAAACDILDLHREKRISEALQSAFGKVIEKMDRVESQLCALNGTEAVSAAFDEKLSGILKQKAEEAARARAEIERCEAELRRFAQKLGELEKENRALEERNAVLQKEALEAQKLRDREASRLEEKKALLEEVKERDESISGLREKIQKLEEEKALLEKERLEKRKLEEEAEAGAGREKGLLEEKKRLEGLVSALREQNEALEKEAAGSSAREDSGTGKELFMDLLEEQKHYLEEKKAYFEEKERYFEKKKAFLDASLRRSEMKAPAAS